MCFFFELFFALMIPDSGNDLAHKAIPRTFIIQDFSGNIRWQRTPGPPGKGRKMSTR